MAEQALLFDRGWFGVALRNNQAAQRGPMLAGNLLPDRLAEIVAEAHAAIGFFLRQKNSPAIVRHFDVIKCGPSLWCPR